MPKVSKRPLKGGYIVVLQTHGRSGQYNPHLHIIASSGGLDEEGQRWEHLSYLPYKMLHKKWQWYLLEMMRKELDTEEIEKIVDACYRCYPEGFVANVQKGEVPERYESLARYVAKYVVSPPISLRRIDEYDGRRVTYHYRSHEMQRVKKERVSVYRFIGRMIQHVLPKGFKRIRYYGVQAAKIYEQIKVIVREALKRIGREVVGAVKIIGRKSYQERYRASTGQDPFVCEHCGREMELNVIWHPKYGIIYNEIEEIMRGKYEPKEEKVIKPEGDGGTIRPTPRRVQIPLFSM
uniref:Transposase IS801/IS1294 domain-containing protein n=1 Tax=Kuenenia stuttgartiensis TaxID=174633 RepID=Q1Q731_KUEST|nr:hypothetical protein kuste2633 [Candidatus Kuenenia stuttgartiensis]